MPHFHCHHALGYERLANLSLEDTAVQDTFCVYTDRYPGPGNRGCRMKQRRQVEQTNHSGEGCSGSVRIGADRATVVIQFAVGF